MKEPLFPPLVLAVRCPELILKHYSKHQNLMKNYNLSQCSSKKSEWFQTCQQVNGFLLLQMPLYWFICTLHDNELPVQCSAPSFKNRWKNKWFEGIYGSNWQTTFFLQAYACGSICANSKQQRLLKQLSNICWICVRYSISNGSVYDSLVNRSSGIQSEVNPSERWSCTY